MMVQCHSASMFHDYRLRGGSGGSFSLSATRKNYELSLAQLSVESEDPNASRIIRKNLYRPEVCSVGGCDKPSASRIAAGRCSRTSARPRQSEALRRREARLRQRRPRQDPRVLRDERVAEARARRVQARAALRGHLRAPAARLDRASAGLRCLCRGLRSPARHGHAGGRGRHPGRCREVADRGLRARPHDGGHPAPTGLVGRNEGHLRGAGQRGRAARGLRDERRRHGVREASPRSTVIPPSQNGLLVHDFDPTYARPTAGSRASCSRRRAATSARTRSTTRARSARPPIHQAELPTSTRGSSTPAKPGVHPRPPAHVPAQHGAHAELHE